MSKTSRRPGAQRKQSRATPRRNTCTALIPLDTAAVRAEHVDRCRWYAAKFLKTEADLRQFRDHDLEAFRTWAMMAHPALQSELRDLAEKLRYEEAVEAEARALYMRQRMNRRDSYRHAMSRVDDIVMGRVPPPPMSDTDDKDDTTDDDADGSPWNEIGKMFRETMGIEDTEFAEFMKEEDEELKSCYRKLCKLLHPDAATIDLEGRARLWNEVQEAYADNDEIRLDDLLVHVELLVGAYERYDTVGEVIDLQDKIELAIETVEEEITEARQHPAWQFGRWTEKQRAAINKRLKRELETAIGMQKMLLQEKIYERTQATRERKLPSKKQKRAPQQVDADPHQPSFAWDMAD